MTARTPSTRSSSTGWRSSPGCSTSRQLLRQLLRHPAESHRARHPHHRSRRRTAGRLPPADRRRAPLAPRAGEGAVLAESAKVIRRALAAGHRPRSFLMGERWLADLEDVLTGVDADVPVYLGEPGTLEALTGYHMHRGALAAMYS